MLNTKPCTQFARKVLLLRLFSIYYHSTLIILCSCALRRLPRIRIRKQKVSPQRIQPNDHSRRKVRERGAEKYSRGRSQRCRWILHESRGDLSCSKFGSHTVRDPSNLIQKQIQNSVSIDDAHVPETRQLRECVRWKAEAVVGKRRSVARSSLVVWTLWK